MFYADTVGLKTVLERIEEFRSRHGDELWPPAPLLRRLAESGSSFAEFDRRKQAAAEFSARWPRQRIASQHQRRSVSRREPHPGRILRRKTSARSILDCVPVDEFWSKEVGQTSEAISATNLESRGRSCERLRRWVSPPS